MAGIAPRAIQIGRVHTWEASHEGVDVPGHRAARALHAVVRHVVAELGRIGKDLGQTWKASAQELLFSSVVFRSKSRTFEGNP